MVRMLGFSDEDKQRIGIAQQGASNGVIQGVFRLPGRLVGGILGGSSTEAAANAGSHNQVTFHLIFFLRWGLFTRIYELLSSRVYFIKSNC